MKVDFRAPHLWHELNDSVDHLLDLRRRGAYGRVYAGLHHALSEATLGLTRQFPNRKKVFYIKNIDPYFEQHMMALAREGCLVTALDPAVLQDPTPLIQALDAEALFILYPEDDPLLGRLHPVENLETALADKKIVRLRISHSNHFYLPLPQSLARNEVRIWSMGPGLALALIGERTKWTSLTAEGIALPLSALDDFRGLLQPLMVNPVAIERFEAESPGGAQAVLKGQPRLFDRAVVSWVNLDGLAVIERLARRRGIALSDAGTPGPLEAASRHRWGGVRTMDWLKSYGLTENQIRGLVIIDHKLLDNELTGLVAAVVDEIVRIQNG